MQVSVVIGTRDRAHLLRDTLAALAAQEIAAPLDWEIVVVDNGSRDGTESVVAAFAQMEKIPIRCVREPRPGISHARNRGIREARGGILAFTDDDVLPAPDWIAGLIAALARWNADGVGGRIHPKWEAEPPRWLTGNENLMARLAIMEDERSKTLALPIIGKPQVWGPNMAFRRDVFEKVGDFDPRRGVVGKKLFRDEETDFVRRALGRGLKIVYEPSLRVFHRIGPDRLRKRYFRKLYFDAGEGKARVEPLPAGGPLFGAPLRLLRLPLSFLKWGMLTLLRRPTAFDQQLGCFWLAGQFAGYWRQARRRTPIREEDLEPSVRP